VFFSIVIWFLKETRIHGTNVKINELKKKNSIILLKTQSVRVIDETEYEVSCVYEESSGFQETLEDSHFLSWTLMQESRQSSSNFVDVDFQAIGLFYVSSQY